MKIAFILLSIVTCSCQPLFKGKKVSIKKDFKALNAPSFEIDTQKYANASNRETKLKISLSAQKATLLNGVGEVILQSDVSTGMAGRGTPKGRFTILERIVDKRSNKYGQYVDKETKKVVVAKAWEHKGKKPANTVYQGIAMPYWMRLTWYGVGMHVGKFEKGKRSSFGCIRVPEEAQPYFYEKTRLGTRVVIE